MTFKDRALFQFTNRVARFQKLLTLNAPPAILAKEGGMIIRAVLGIVGGAALAEVGDHLVADERELAGLCRFHDDVDKPITTERTESGASYGMCADCLAEAREGESDDAGC